MNEEIDRIDTCYSFYEINILYTCTSFVIIKKIILMNNNQYLVHLASLSPQDYFFILLIHNNCTNSRRENFVDNKY